MQVRNTSNSNKTDVEYVEYNIYLLLDVIDLCYNLIIPCLLQGYVIWGTKIEGEYEKKMPFWFGFQAFIAK